MRSRFLLVFFTAACLHCPLASAQLPPLPPQATIRVETNEVPIAGAVTNSRLHPVKGLLRDDFKVFDNGVEQPISFFAVNEEPMQIVLLIEDSVADILLARHGKSPFSIADALLVKLP